MAVELKPIISLKGRNNTRRDLFLKSESGYSVYRIIPDRFIESGKLIEEILSTLSALKRPKIRLGDNKNVIYEPNLPIFYEILFKDGKIHFNYVVPEKYENIIVNKLRKVFKTATINKTEDYFDNFKDTFYCPFEQKYHFMYSLNTDYRENALIENILGVTYNIEKEDKVLLQIGVVPLSDSWKEKWKNAYNRVKNGEDLTVSKNIPSLIFDNLFKLSEGFISISDMIMGIKPEEINKKDKFNFIDNKEFSNYISKRATLQKVNYDGFEVQIKLFCNNKERVYYYGKIFDGVFKVLDADQELILGKCRMNKSNNRSFDFKVNKNIMSTKEVAIFLQQPNRRLQLEFKDSLESIQVIETEIPKQLRQGGIPIGYATYKGEKILTSWNIKDRHIAPMHKVITGLQRTGKSSYIKNFAIEAIKQGHSVILIDTIKNCEVANDVRDYMPEEFKDKIIVLDYGDLDYLLPLAWNEVKIDPKSRLREKMKISSMLAGNFEYFLDTVVDARNKDDLLSPRMKKYLSSACKLVLSQENTTIKDVLDCLTNVTDRHRFIESSGLSTNSSTVMELLRLDETDKQGNIRTKYSEISGIIDRASILFNDYVMEMLLSTPPNPDIDFVKWTNEGKCILIKMSELDFSRTTLKALVTFMYSKIWLSMLMRGNNNDKPRITHVILDEIHNFPQVTEMLKLNCREAAKFGLSYVFTSHLLKDLKGLLPYIKGSGANFMLFKTTKENFKLMEEEIKLGGFELEDCLKIKDYHTLNIVNYDRDYVVYISKVIDMVEKRFKKFNRSYIDDICKKKYGRIVDF